MEKESIAIRHFSNYKIGYLAIILTVFRFYFFISSSMERKKTGCLFVSHQLSAALDYYFKCFCSSFFHHNRNQ